MVWDKMGKNDKDNGIGNEESEFLKFLKMAESIKAGNYEVRPKEPRPKKKKVYPKQHREDRQETEYTPARTPEIACGEDTFTSLLERAASIGAEKYEAPPHKPKKRDRDIIPEIIETEQYSDLEKPKKKEKQKKPKKEKIEKEKTKWFKRESKEKLEEKAEKSKEKKPLGFWKKAAATAVIAGTLLGGGSIGGKMYLDYSYKSILTAADSNPKLKRENIERLLTPASTFYFADGKTPIGTVGDVKSIKYDMPLEKIKEACPACVPMLMAVEDTTHGANDGVNWKNTAGSAVITALSKIFNKIPGGKYVNNALGLKRMGGSTITQQLAKNIWGREVKKDLCVGSPELLNWAYQHLVPSSSFKAKAVEIANSLQLRKKYSPDQIMEWFLTQGLNYGRDKGLKGAAKYFFDKDIAEGGKLDAIEAAFIIGQIKGPANYNPFSENKKAAKRNIENAESRTLQALLRLYKENNYYEKSVVESDEAAAKKSVDEFNKLFSREEIKKFIAEYEIQEMPKVWNDSHIVKFNKLARYLADRSKFKIMMGVEKKKLSAGLNGLSPIEKELLFWHKGEMTYDRNSVTMAAKNELQEIFNTNMEFRARLAEQGITTFEQLASGGARIKLTVDWQDYTNSVYALNHAASEVGWRLKGYHAPEVDKEKVNGGAQQKNELDRNEFYTGMIKEAAIKKKGKSPYQIEEDSYVKVEAAGIEGKIGAPALKRMYGEARKFHGARKSWTMFDGLSELLKKDSPVCVSVREKKDIGNGKYEYVFDIEEKHYKRDASGKIEKDKNSRKSLLFNGALIAMDSTGAIRFKTGNMEDTGDPVDYTTFGPGNQGYFGGSTFKIFTSAELDKLGLEPIQPIGNVDERNMISSRIIPVPLQVGPDWVPSESHIPLNERVTDYNAVGESINNGNSNKLEDFVLYVWAIKGKDAALQLIRSTPLAKMADETPKKYYERLRDKFGFGVTFKENNHGYVAFDRAQRNIAAKISAFESQYSASTGAGSSAGTSISLPEGFASKEEYAQYLKEQARQVADMGYGNPNVVKFRSGDAWVEGVAIDEAIRRVGNVDEENDKAWNARLRHEALAGTFTKVSQQRAAAGAGGAEIDKRKTLGRGISIEMFDMLRQEYESQLAALKGKSTDELYSEDSLLEHPEFRKLAGRMYVAQALRNNGFKNKIDVTPSMILGTINITVGEIAEAIAKNLSGKACKPYIIDEIALKDNIIYKRNPECADLGINENIRQKFAVTLRGAGAQEKGTVAGLNRMEYELKEDGSFRQISSPDLTLDVVYKDETGKEQKAKVVFPFYGKTGTTNNSVANLLSGAIPVFDDNENPQDKNMQHGSYTMDNMLYISAVMMEYKGNPKGYMGRLVTGGNSAGMALQYAALEYLKNHGQDENIKKEMLKPGKTIFLEQANPNPEKCAVVYVDSHGFYTDASGCLNTDRRPDDMSTGEGLSLDECVVKVEDKRVEKNPVFYERAVPAFICQE